MTLATVNPGGAMEIRELTEADAEPYRALRLRALREDPEGFGTTYEEAAARTLEHTASRLRATAESSDDVTLGAFDGETLVGMVTLIRDDGAKDRHKASVFAMYVAEEERGRGIGRALMETAIAHARQIVGLEQLHLAAVTTNAPARHLYLSLGFLTYGIEPHALKQGDRYWDEELLALRL